MTTLPEPPHTPTAPAAGQPIDDQRINRIADAFSQALEEATAIPTVYKDPTPVPAIGPTPPVPQPGRPPMSEKATDDSVRMISAGFLTLCAGGAVSGVLYFSGQADPTVIGMMAAVPVGLAVPILALSRLAKRAKETVAAAPPVIHQHYTGTVNQDQRQVNTLTRGVVATTRNQLPR